MNRLPEISKEPGAGKLTKKPSRILVIDDEPDMLSGFSSILSALGFSPLAFSDGPSALKILQQEEFDLIFCDLLMDEMNGFEIIKEANKISPGTPIIIFTAYGTVERAVQAMQLGAFDFLEKPVDTEKLKIVIEKGLRQKKFFKERNNLIRQLDDKFQFDNIVGRSEEMLKIFEMIENISKTDVNVLVTGESGTGKELIARSIHAHSSRKTKPFVPVNCGAFPEHLFEAELFGYEKGAFTGAASRKMGLLEYANEGTFFLDEVCELPLNLQVKLLRVLQERAVRRLGGNELISVNFRIISATNHDFDRAAELGQLRSDLYYRLNVINIHLPPLRQRKEDIALLAGHFLKKFIKTAGKNISGFSDEVIKILESYAWPGNIRELENVIERMVIMSKGDVITLADLPPKLINEDLKGLSFDNLKLPEAKQKAIDEVEKKYLIYLLRKYNGNVTHMALEAGMTRRNIHRLLNIYGFDPDKWRK
ncbi:MAG: sigma-54-dependent transcriptional regulator [Bacteroidota bacterium]|jgi:DNA-binding NtrC family response regulator|nr:sigma-54-dependent Fis family transcriptional regulator [Ignavibacteria bacterium]MCU7499501.1 sigma-54-dependent Fis family transcriptional regulator [Ignavibacteria bacterium]MCU7511451.1 sigma-54-dependent Fis family transcriptional regulator [Ignavibacteria bacterium]MCU7519448.1 sigma-54-dependent Fis family transcriptional regulator [Ignavibacteria bacterium]MCU7524669.1 sigma-54-dependent Fis family transcriptional regulator [Ignavibacteria bacterium]